VHVLREFAPPSTRFAVVELDSEDNVGRLTEWFTSKWSQRAAATFNRHFDALRSAAAFWASQGWLTTDPTRLLRRRGRAPDRTRAIPAADIEALLSMDAPIREKTLWTMLYETAAGLLGHAMPGQQHQRPHAQARPDRGRRHLHQADAAQAGRAAIRVRGRLQARYNRLVRRFGGNTNPGAKKKAITAIARTLLKIAYQVLKSGTPYQELGADFCTRRESPSRSRPGCNASAGTVRVVLALPSWDDYLRTGLDDLIESASQSPMVLVRDPPWSWCGPGPCLPPCGTRHPRRASRRSPAGSTAPSSLEPATSR